MKSKKRAIRRKHERHHKNILKERYEYQGHRWWIRKQNGYYKKEYKSENHRGNRYSSLKKQSNRRIRRYKGEIPHGNKYRKLFDLWWTFY